MVIAVHLYAVSNVMQEILLKNRSMTPAEWLSGVGLSAAVVSGLQSLILESSAMGSLQWGGEVELSPLCFSFLSLLRILAHLGSSVL